MTADGGAGPAAVTIGRAIERAIGTALGRAIGPDENFFDAGLTSLALVRVHTESTRGLAAPPPVTALFAYPNLRALHRFLLSHAGEGAVRPLAPPVPAGAAGRRELRRRARGEVA